MNTFNHGQMIQSVTLVGLGGTGSQLARSVCRIVYDLKVRRKHVPHIRFVDPDRVEPKNLGRQAYMLRGIYSTGDQIPDQMINPAVVFLFSGGVPHR